MKALVVKRFGNSPEKIVEERLKPSTREGFSLIRMHSAIVKAGVLVEVNGQFVTVANKVLDRIIVCQLRDVPSPVGDRIFARYAPRQTVRLWDRLHGYLLRFGRRAADNFVRLKLARRRHHQPTQNYEHKITRMLGE